MKKFIGAFISFHDNMLAQITLGAESEFDALEQLLGSKGFEAYDDITSCDDLKRFAFDCDCMISAYEV